MTIVAKDGASTSGGDSAYGDDSKPPYASSSRDPPPPQADGPGLPSYSESIAGTSSQTQTPTTALPPATNYIYINNSNGPVHGTWVIDTDMTIPSGLLPPLGLFSKATDRQHLHLATQMGEVKATVILTSGSATRARIKMESQCGKIIAQIMSRVNRQAFSLKATTQYGEMTICIPRDYIGPIKCKSGWGKIEFSEALQASVVSFSNEMAFVGNWNTSGFNDYKTWEGDEIDVKTQCGNIRFKYADEFDPHAPTFNDTIQKVFTNTIQGIYNMFNQRR
ncbi:hypothetical protein CPB86DRAFT_790097 [Serendipita vermifera]|nr:hypothetical protein CPB86DRAFT_790097 [Serendipita vermifera]